MNAKKLATAILSVFLFISIATAIYNEFSPRPSSLNQETMSKITQNDKMIVYYFHGYKRCYTCKTIEAYTREAVLALSSERIEVRSINLEENENEHFIEDYKLTNRTVVISQIKDHKEQQWKDLNKVWELVSDKEHFISYIQDEIKKLQAVN